MRCSVLSSPMVELMSDMESGDVSRMSGALQTLKAMWLSVEIDTLPDLSRGLLAPLAQRGGYEDHARICDLLLTRAGEGDREALPALSALSALDMPASGQHALGLALQVRGEPADALEQVLRHMAAHLPDLPVQRIEPMGHLLDCLLDGRPEVQEATLRAVLTWPPLPSTLSVLRAAQREELVSVIAALEAAVPLR